MVDVKATVAENAAVEIENHCRKHIKSKSLTNEAFTYMSKLIEEDCPRNARELYRLIADFMTDGMAYNEDNAFKVCEVLSRIFLEKKLLLIEQRDTIVAEKLSNPIVMAQQKADGSMGAIRDEDFLDPFTGMERAKSNTNT